MPLQQTEQHAVITPRLTVVAPRSQLTEKELPRTLVGWLVFLWSRVLFPGVPEPATAWRWKPLVILLLASGALLFPCLSFFLFEPDEGRYAQIPREMLTRGEWLVPTLQGEPYLDKPPLFYWLVMASYSLFGYHDWAARLVPAFAVEGCILLTYLLGRRLLGERPAFWGALFLVLMPGFTGMGRLLVLDGVLTFWVTLSLFAAARAAEGPRLRLGWWLVTALACGLGVLTKGPVGLVLLLPPLWLYRRLGGCTARIGRRGWLIFFAIIVAIAVPWYIAVCMRLPDFARNFFLVHNVQRFVQPFDHDRPVWFYLPVLLAGLLPASLLVLPLTRFLASESAAARRCPALGYLLLAAGWCILFFSLAGCKLPTYILPAFPPLALAFGVLAAQRWGSTPREGSLTWLRVGTCGWWLLAIVGHNIVLPAAARARSPMADMERMTALCGDPAVPVICFPRHVDSVAFYVGRADFPAMHTKNIGQLLAELDKHPRTVVLFGHRSSLQGLKHFLPPHLHIVESAPMGLCDVGVVERKR
jgi:4-amino-4-deoxy-L-arabinose transferase-like glycosyltransferase